MKLGWRWTRANSFQGPDQQPLRDSFADIQRFMTWPHIGLKFDGTFAMGATFTTSIVPMVVIPGPPQAADPFGLYGSTTVHVRVPRTFNTWLVVASANFLTAGSANTPIRGLGFTINGTTNEDWLTHGHHNLAGGLRATASMKERVKKGDVINVCASVNVTPENLSKSRAWMYFLPLA